MTMETAATKIAAKRAARTQRLMAPVTVTAKIDGDRMDMFAKLRGRLRRHRRFRQADAVRAAMVTAGARVFDIGQNTIWDVDPAHLPSWGTAKDICRLRDFITAIEGGDFTRGLVFPV